MSWLGSGHSSVIKRASLCTCKSVRSWIKQSRLIWSARSVNWMTKNPIGVGLNQAVNGLPLEP